MTKKILILSLFSVFLLSACKTNNIDDVVEQEKNQIKEINSQKINISTSAEPIKPVEKVSTSSVVQKNDQATSTQVSTSTENIIASTTKGYGTIEGHMNYINPLYEGLKTCAEDIKTKERFCTSDYNVVDTGRGTHVRLYKISNVPEGGYYVYTEDLKKRRGYYSELAVCGLKVECESKKELIIVNVEAGKTVSSVDPLDWYIERHY